MTFDLDQTVADLREIFNTDQYKADDDMAVARYTAERALRAYGCPDDIAETIGSMIYWASCNVARDTMNRTYGVAAWDMYDIFEKAQRSGEVAA